MSQPKERAVHWRRQPDRAEARLTSALQIERRPELKAKDDVSWRKDSCLDDFNVRFEGRTLRSFRTSDAQSDRRTAAFDSSRTPLVRTSRNTQDVPFTCLAMDTIGANETCGWRCSLGACRF